MNIKQVKRSLPKGSYIRFVIPDTHGCYAEPQAISVMLADIERAKPASVIMLGDHLDCGGFLAQHQTLGYVAEADYSYADDCEATNQLLDAIQSRVPEKCVIEYLEGNHERRIEKWCLTSTLRHKKDANDLLKAFGVESRLNMVKRGIKLFRQGVYYDDLPIPATIRRGRCHFTHGSMHGLHAAMSHLKKFGGNVVFGHTHREDSCRISTIKEGVIGAWNPGCMCRLQPLWMHTQPTDWSNGYHLQIVEPSGKFLPINIPVIDGWSGFDVLMNLVGGI